jgi:hypothetical protein
LEKAGLIADMVAAVAAIAAGRDTLEIDGMEHEGMVNFKKGNGAAAALYAGAMNSNDCELMLLAEYTYLSEEREHAEDDQRGAEASAAAALQSFDDAFLALQAVEDADFYKCAELTFPHRKGWRYNGCPNDAFQLACAGHITRINNGLSRFGINRRDRELAQLRIQMFELAQEVYLAKQKKALGK